MDIGVSPLLLALVKQGHEDVLAAEPRSSRRRGLGSGPPSPAFSSAPSSPGSVLSTTTLSHYGSDLNRDFDVLCKVEDALQRVVEHEEVHDAIRAFEDLHGTTPTVGQLIHALAGGPVHGHGHDSHGECAGEQPFADLLPHAALQEPPLFFGPARTLHGSPLCSGIALQGAHQDAAVSSAPSSPIQSTPGHAALPPASTPQPMRSVFSPQLGTMPQAYGTPPPASPLQGWHHDQLTPPQAPPEEGLGSCPDSPGGPPVARRGGLSPTVSRAAPRPAIPGLNLGNIKKRSPLVRSSIAMALSAGVQPGEGVPPSPSGLQPGAAQPPPGPAPGYPGSRPQDSSRGSPTEMLRMLLPSACKPRHGHGHASHAHNGHHSTGGGASAASSGRGSRGGGAQPKPPPPQQQQPQPQLQVQQQQPQLQLQVQQQHQQPQLQVQQQAAEEGRHEGGAVEADGGGWPGPVSPRVSKDDLVEDQHGAGRRKTPQRAARATPQATPEKPLSMSGSLRRRHLEATGSRRSMEAEGRLGGKGSVGSKPEGLGHVSEAGQRRWAEGAVGPEDGGSPVDSTRHRDTSSKGAAGAVPAAPVLCFAQPQSGVAAADPQQLQQPARARPPVPMLALPTAPFHSGLGSAAARRTARAAAAAAASGAPLPGGCLPSARVPPLHLGLATGRRAAEQQQPHGARTRRMQPGRLSMSMVRASGEGPLTCRRMAAAATRGLTSHALGTAFWADDQRDLAYLYGYGEDGEYDEYEEGEEYDSDDTDEDGCGSSEEGTYHAEASDEEEDVDEVPLVVPQLSHPCAHAAVPSLRRSGAWLGLRDSGVASSTAGLLAGLVSEAGAAAQVFAAAAAAAGSLTARVRPLPVPALDDPAAPPLPLAAALGALEHAVAHHPAALHHDPQLPHAHHHDPHHLHHHHLDLQQQPQQQLHAVQHRGGRKKQRRTAAARRRAAALARARARYYGSEGDDSDPDRCSLMLPEELWDAWERLSEGPRGWQHRLLESLTHVERITCTSYSTVSKACHQGQPVVVKIYDVAERDKLANAFAEIGVLLHLAGWAGAVKLLDYGRHEDKVMLMLESCDHSLKAWCDSQRFEAATGPDFIMECLRLWGTLAALVAELHERWHVAHCDLKPGNVLMVGGRLLLADFSESMLFNGAPLLLEQARGTVSYQPPEMVHGHCVDARKADVWAMGCILYEMVTGEVLFKGNSDCMRAVTPAAAAAAASSARRRQRMAAQHGRAVNSSGGGGGGTSGGGGQTSGGGGWTSSCVSGSEGGAGRLRGRRSGADSDADVDAAPLMLRGHGSHGGGGQGGGLPPPAGRPACPPLVPRLHLGLSLPGRSAAAPTSQLTTSSVSLHQQQHQQQQGGYQGAPHHHLPFHQPLGLSARSLAAGGGGLGTARNLELIAEGYGTEDAASTILEGLSARTSDWAGPSAAPTTAPTTARDLSTARTLGTARDLGTARGGGGGTARSGAPAGPSYPNTARGPGTARSAGGPLCGGGTGAGGPPCGSTHRSVASAASGAAWPPPPPPSAGTARSVAASEWTLAAPTPTGTGVEHAGTSCQPGGASARSLGASSTGGASASRGERPCAGGAEAQGAGRGAAGGELASGGSVKSLVHLYNSQALQQQQQRAPAPLPPHRRMRHSVATQCSDPHGPDWFATEEADRMRIMCEEAPSWVSFAAGVGAAAAAAGGAAARRSSGGGAPDGAASSAAGCGGEAGAGAGSYRARQLSGSDGPSLCDDVLGLLRLVLVEDRGRPHMRRVAQLAEEVLRRHAGDGSGDSSDSADAASGLEQGQQGQQRADGEGAPAADGAQQPHRDRNQGLQQQQQQGGQQGPACSALPGDPDEHVPLREVVPRPVLAAPRMLSLLPGAAAGAAAGEGEVFAAAELMLPLPPRLPPAAAPQAAQPPPGAGAAAAAAPAGAGVAAATVALPQPPPAAFAAPQPTRLQALALGAGHGPMAGPISVAGFFIDEDDLQDSEEDPEGQAGPGGAAGQVGAGAATGRDDATRADLEALLAAAGMGGSGGGGGGAVRGLLGAAQPASLFDTCQPLQTARGGRPFSRTWQRFLAPGAAAAAPAAAAASGAASSSAGGAATTATATTKGSAGGHAGSRGGAVWRQGR